MTSKNKILIHRDELKESGVDILSLHGLNFTDLELHRDDHYMFILQKSGVFVGEVDFNKIQLHGAGVCYIAPGQVHRYIKVKSEGWLLFLDADYVSKQFREVFDAVMNQTQKASLDKNDSIIPIADHLEKYWSGRGRNNELMLPVIKSLLDAIVGLIAYKLSATFKNAKYIGSVKYSLSNRFKHMIRKHFKDLKQVKAYASLLHITPLYLNEVMKEVTGFTASYWICQEITLEAKRLLAYSDKDIREIAWELGYEDHAYFSRFFKKNTGITASAFRLSKP
ncbi:helix-turn-helix domain-containing protein [Niabella sp. 22666]|uniref:helix-turn-helix domain-containing protein n=1 Tax=Niabella sp. 22666 TaxID=3453954 RepID=UPI003F86F273